MRGIRLGWKLFEKDLKIEMRRGELGAMVILGVVGLSVVLAYGTWLAGVAESQRLILAPTLALSVLLMTALSVIGKFSEYDYDSGALEGLRLAEVPSEALYLSRVGSIFVISFMTAVAACFMLPTLLGLAPLALVGSLDGCLVCAGVAVGLASCGALIAPIAARVQVGSLFLLTLMLPLIIPLFFAGCEILALVSNNQSFWWTVLVSLDAIYLAAGLWLHPHVLK